MNCPHCLVNYHSSQSNTPIGSDVEGAWKIAWETCPSCKKLNIWLEHWQMKYHTMTRVGTRLLHPKTISRSALSPSVESIFADDYKEACNVIVDSPKASAALSRRCLQNLLREKAAVTHSNLNNEIEEVLKSQKLPSHLAEGLDAVRTIGNFAAHPIKSDSTGEIVPVESGEAEWLLEILEGLFDFYFVQPAKMQERKLQLNRKLQDSGKQPLK